MTDLYESKFECRTCKVAITTILPAPRCWHCFSPMERVATADRPTKGAIAVKEFRNMEDASHEPSVVDLPEPADFTSSVTVDVLRKLAARMDTYASDQIAFNRKGWGTRKERGERIVRAGAYKELAAEFRHDADKIEGKK